MDSPERVGAGSDFARSVLDGLSAPNKRIEPRWLYDGVGAKLFEAITLLDSYYLTAAELELMTTHAGEMAAALGSGVTVIEPGSGEALKVRPLLAALGEGAAKYVPIDIAEDQLASIARTLESLFPTLTVTPVAADFFKPFALEAHTRPVVYFAGSTIGNMSEEVALSFLKSLAAGTRAERLLVGYDLVKDRAVMEAAYDDPAGVTAAFEKNVLQRINRELGADFDLTAFGYRARFNAATSAIEMHLVSERQQTVRIDGRTVAFHAGETIHTEDSRKFTLDGFAAFAERAGFRAVRSWTDSRSYFAVTLLERV